MVHIAVIGGGPKAAALAAKAAAIRASTFADITITIFEKDAIGAHWSGASGYTDGIQDLCTSASRDVAFPDNSVYGPLANAKMAQYSWAAFLRNRVAQTSYHRWIDAGSRSESHAVFSEYLYWVIVESEANAVKGTVHYLEPVGGRWKVHFRSRDDELQVHGQLFDGVVVTGPGEPNDFIRATADPGLSFPTQRMFNGKDFWLRLDEMGERIKDLTHSPVEDPIVVVGAGGTGAAIMAWLVKNGARDLPLQLVTELAAIYTRVDSVFENRLFSDETLWPLLPATKQDEFYDRTNRGVVWNKVNAVLETATNLSYAYGRATEKKVTAADGFHLLVDGATTQYTIVPAVLIDATGFNRWWFLDLLILDPNPDTVAWEEGIGFHLELVGTPWKGLPPLHAPMCSRKQGPGFGSLMVLGAMSDRILSMHAPPGG